MSSFIDPRGRYPLSATPAPPSSARSVAHDMLSPTTKDPRKAATATPTSIRYPRLPKSDQILQNSGSSKATRSQSRGLDGDEVLHTALRGSGKAKGKKAQPDLSSQSEDYGLNNLYSGRDSQPSEEVVEDSSIPESPNEHNISGTTLHPTDSEPETGDVDALLMVDSLPDLQRATTAILDFFATNSSSPSGVADLARALQNPKSSQSRRLHRMRTNFAAQKENFGSETYLTIEQVAAKLPALEISSGSSTKTWHVDGILYKTNCAQLALEIFTKHSRSDSVEDSMYDLEGKFPLPFLNELVHSTRLDSAGKSGLRRPTFDLALDMRTQFLMTSLVTQQDRDNYNPLGLLHHVFYNEILETQASQDDLLLRGFNSPTLQDRDGNLPARYEDDVQDRIRDIREYLDDDGTVDFQGLEARFSWEAFVYSVAKWLRSRNEELDRYMKQQPSIDDIRDQLEDAVNRRTSLNQPAVTPENTKATSSAEISSSQQPRRELLPPAEITEKRSDIAEKGVERRKSGPKIFGDQKSIQSMFRKAKQLDSADRSIDSAREPAKGFAPRLSQLAAKPTEKTAARATSSRRAEEIPPVASFSTDPDRTLINDYEEDPVFPSPQRSQPNPQSQTSRRPRVSAPRYPHAVISENDHIPSSQSIPSSQAIMDEIKRHKQSRAFIDRQSNATRVSPIDSQRVGLAGPSTQRKRTRAERDDSEDEYEEDNRAINVQGKRAQKPAQTAKRQRTEPEPASMELEDYEPPARRHRQIPWQNTHPPATQTQPQVEQARPVATQRHPSTTHRQTTPAANDTASTAYPAYSSQQPSSQASPTSMPRGVKPQVRRRWTPDEDKRMIELVAKYGTSWAVIKHQDDVSPNPQLSERNQGQLKDRARNLVMMWYRGGRRELPTNFEYVSLKQKDIEELESRGIQIPERPLPRNVIRF